jgi:hypothetical protein
LSDKIGEVVESSTGGFTAQCYELHEPPPFGSLVKITDGDLEVYAVVSNATTTSIEPGRRPIARGKSETSEDDVFAANPQLERLLRTDFDTLVVGYKQGEQVYQFLPSKPARIHDFIILCEPAEVAAFNQSLDYLSLLLNAEAQSGELVAASLRFAAATHGNSRDFLVRAGKELARLLANDTNRLTDILRRMKG